MSDAQTPESREGLMDTCSRMQLHTGLDDPSWKEKFGNEKGLYGFVTAAVQQSNRELLDDLYRLAITTAFDANGDDKALQIQAGFGRKAFAWIKERQQAGGEQQ